MLKVITLYLFYISIIINFEVESITLERQRKPKRDVFIVKCDTIYDCYDFRMICSNEICTCAKFHDWEPHSKRCAVNYLKIANWLKATTSTDPGTVSQQVDFDRVEVNGSIRLYPKWADYEAEKETGISHITRVIWPMLLGILLVFVIYGAILLNLL